MPGAIAEAPEPHRQFFTGVFLKGHDREVSEMLGRVFTRISGLCHVADPNCLG
jgi:hypothetical protein